MIGSFLGLLIIVLLIWFLVIFVRRRRGKSVIRHYCPFMLISIVIKISALKLHFFLFIAEREQQRNIMFAQKTDPIQRPLVSHHKVYT